MQQNVVATNPIVTIEMENGSETKDMVFAKSDIAIIRLVLDFQTGGQKDWPLGDRMIETEFKFRRVKEK